MPELPEVETVRRGLEAVLAGRRFARVVVRRGDLRRPLPPGFAAALEGRRVLALDRRAKYLVLRMEGGLVLLAHLGMSGCMRITPGRPPVLGPHDHVVFETGEGPSVTFRDPRRFGLLALAEEDALADHPLLRDLGPEPLDASFTGRTLAMRLAGRASPLKAALLDQRTVAGLGNIYVCEALFRAGLSPFRKAGSVRARRAERLVLAIKTVLEEAIRSGGSSLRDHVRPDGELGYFQHAFAVYGRAGERCPSCDCASGPHGGIKRLVQGGRSTFYCPRRQR